MIDTLTRQLTQLAFAVVTGAYRPTPGQRQAIADLNAAVACTDRPAGRAPALASVHTPHTKEPA